MNQPSLMTVGRLGPEPVQASRRQLIGRMSIIIVQEGEERAFRPRTLDEPVEEFAIDLRCRLAAVVERPQKTLNVSKKPRGRQPILREERDRTDALERSIHKLGRLQYGELGEDVVLVECEAAGQPRIGAAVCR